MVILIILGAALTITVVICCCLKISADVDNREGGNKHDKL